ncbi:MAG TPA: hypothetical protein VFW07_23265 [Parafilimonas sp.]|nr:hypothetical protein [Parafilimonas sp.]
MEYLKGLFFDKKIVRAIRQSNTDADFLYSRLFIGKITLQEFYLLK